MTLSPGELYNMQSYNYGGQGLEGTPHWNFDVIPWEKWGNTPDDDNNHRSKNYALNENHKRLEQTPSALKRQIAFHGWWHTYSQKIECPVDIGVFDNTGNLVGRVINNTVDYNFDNGVSIFVDGDTKYVFLTPS